MNPNTAGPPGTPKAEFLDSVRRALGRLVSHPGPSTPAAEEVLRDLETKAEEIRQRVAGGRAALLDKLAKMSQLGGWNLYRAPGPEEAIEYLCTLASSLGVRRVARTDQDIFRSALGGPVDAALRNLGLAVTVAAQNEGLSRESLRQEIIEAGLGITGADYAIAETGSVVVVPRKGLSRLVSLVPPVHLALVRPQDVVGTLDDLFCLRRLEYYRNGGDMGSYLNFITGPSRTADIEQTLVVGVHGPKEVHLVLLG